MGIGGVRCNKCYKEIDDGSQVLTTFCMHCFCLGEYILKLAFHRWGTIRCKNGCDSECANDICQGDNACTVCGEKLNAENVSVEICGNSDSDVFSLRGANPTDVIMVNSLLCCPVQ